MKTDLPRKKWKRLRRCAIAAGCLLAAAALFPFLFPGFIVRRVLANSALRDLPVRFQSATLSPTGKLILRNAVLDDVGESAGKPLISAALVQIEFSWSELLSSKLKKINLDGVSLHLRPGTDARPTLLRLWSPASATQASSLPAPPVASSPPLPGTPRPEAPPLWFDQLLINGNIRLENYEQWETLAQMPAAVPIPLWAVVRMSGDRLHPESAVSGGIGDPDAPTTSNLPVLATRFTIKPDLRSDSTLVVIDTCSLSNFSPAISREIATQWLSDTPFNRNITARLDRLLINGSVAINHDIGLDLSADLRDFSIRTASPGPAISLERFSASTQVEGRWSDNPLRSLAFNRTHCSFDSVQFDEWRLMRGVADLQNDSTQVVLTDLQAAFGDATLKATAAFDHTAGNFTRGRIWLNNINAARVLDRLPLSVRRAIPASVDGIVAARVFLTESDAERVVARVEISCPDDLAILITGPAARRPAVTTPSTSVATPATTPSTGTPARARGGPGHSTILSNLAIGASVSWNYRAGGLPDIARGRLTADELDIFPPNDPTWLSITRVVSDFSMSRGQFRLDDFYANLPERGTFSARATYSLKSRIVEPCSLLVDDLNLAALNPWLSPPFELAGQFDADLQVTLSPSTATLVGTIGTSNGATLKNGQGFLTISGAPAPSLSFNVVADRDDRSLEARALSLHGLGPVRANGSFIQQIRERLGQNAAQLDGLLSRLEKGVDLSLQDLQFNGRIDGFDSAPALRGPVAIAGLTINTPGTGNQTAALENLFFKGNLIVPLVASVPNVPLVMAEPIVNPAQLQIDKFAWGANVVRNLSAKGSFEKARLAVPEISFLFDKGAFTGNGELTLPDLGRLDLRFKGLDQLGLTNGLYPESFTAEGAISGSLSLVREAGQPLAGTIRIDSDSPGRLKISRETSASIFAPPAKAAAASSGIIPEHFDDIVIGQLADYPYSVGQALIQDSPNGMIVRLDYTRVPLTPGEPGYSEPINFRGNIVEASLPIHLHSSIRMENSISRILQQVLGFRESLLVPPPATGQATTTTAPQP